jgi:hypothetical protein
VRLQRLFRRCERGNPIAKRSHEAFGCFTHGFIIIYSGRRDRMTQRPMRQIGILASEGAAWMGWKEFDGEYTTVDVMYSRDHGKTWSMERGGMAARGAGAAAGDASDRVISVPDHRNPMWRCWPRSDAASMKPDTTEPNDRIPLCRRSV